MALTRHDDDPRNHLSHVSHALSAVHRPVWWFVLVRSVAGVACGSLGASAIQVHNPPPPHAFGGDAMQGHNANARVGHDAAAYLRVLW